MGVELAGALKNVIAIAAGIVDGLGYGHNTVAALITRGLAEITRLAVALGGRADTLAGLAGLGDLVLTCTGGLSRNRHGWARRSARAGPWRRPWPRHGRSRKACARRWPPARWPIASGVDLPIGRADAGGALRGPAAARGGRRS